MRRVTIDQLLERSRRRLSRLSPEDAYRRVAAGARLVDVRTREQIAADGSVPGALEVPLTVLEWRLDPDSPNRSPQAPALHDVVIVLCQDGYSSSLAACRLQDIGFAAATDVIGGARAWRAAGLPTVGGAG